MVERSRQQPKSFTVNNERWQRRFEYFVLLVKNEHGKLLLLLRKYLKKIGKRRKFNLNRKKKKKRKIFLSEGKGCNIRFNVSLNKDVTD